MKYYKFELSMLWANIISLVLFVLGIICFNVTYGEYDYPNMIILMLTFIIYLTMHEIIHGLAFSYFCKNKYNVKYGAMLEKGVFYAMCQERINKKATIISLLAPTIVLTVIALIPAFIFRIDLLGLLAIFNLAGAAGDLLMTLFVLRLPNDIKYIDYDSVIGFYLISKHDLSKYKSFYMKYKESGKDSDKLINNSIKTLTITKTSWIIIVVLAIITFLFYLINVLI